MIDKNAYQKAYREKNNWRRKGYSLKYRQSPGGSVNIKTYSLTHQEEILAYQKKYQKEYRKAHYEYIKLYRQTPPAKEASRKQKAKRKHLNFIPLNKPFPGADGHHINYNYVIYIPKELHQSVWHSLTSGVGMKQINKKAFEFLEGGKR